MKINITDKDNNLLFSYQPDDPIIYSDDVEIFNDENEIIVRLKEYETLSDKKIKI